MKHHLLVCPLLLILAACKPAVETAPSPQASAPQVTADGSTHSKLPASTPLPEGVTPFTIEVTLSEPARARLASPAETIVVSVDYFGDATPAANRQANEVGQIELGRVQKEIAIAGKVDVDGSALQGDKLALIQGEPQININVYSGRHSSPDNLLDCDMFQDSVAVAARSPIRIHCRLITEKT